MSAGTYRRFWLVNALGNEFSFTDDNAKIFLNEPQGLGFQKAYTSVRVGNSEIVTSQQFNLTDVTGELLFYRDGNGEKYEDYQNFIQFVKYKPLELHYLTPNSLTAYHCNIIFSQADKSEITELGMLRVPVTFHRLSEWLTDEDTIITLDNTAIDDGKYYNVVYDYHYAGTSLGGSAIWNNGTDDVGFIFTIDGTVQNPSFTLSQNGDIYGICKINGTYDYLMIDSIETEESIYLENGGSVISNPEQYQDMTVSNGKSYLTWTKLKVGETTFAFTCGNIESFDGEITITFKKSYVTV